MDINNLYKEKRRLFGEYEDMRKNLAKENREWTPEEETKLGKYMDDIESIGKKIDIEKRAQLIDMNAVEPEKAKASAPKGDELVELRTNATIKWMTEGPGKLNAEERKYAGLNSTGGLDLGMGSEKRASGTLTTAVNTQETIMQKMLYETKQYYAGWFDAVTEFSTADSRAFDWPTINDSAQTGALEAAGTDIYASSDGLTYLKTTLGGYFVSSQGIGVSIADLANFSVPIEEAIYKPLMTRYWKKLSALATTGTGSSQHDGIVTNAGIGEIVSKNTTPTREDITNLMSKVGYAYHLNEKSGFMFNSSTMYKIAALSVGTSDLRPLWLPSMRDGVPSTLEGFKYWINNDMSAVSATTAKVMLFGDFSTHLLRHAGPVQLVRLDERYAELLQVGFHVVGLSDSDTLDAGTGIKYARTLGT
ncbi:MAG: phage major capsid protein [Nitrosomonadaceae bacterium]